MADLFTNEVIGPLTDAELRATPVLVSGTVTSTPSGTQDVNIVSSVELEIKNDTGNPVPISGSVTTTPLTSSSATVTQVSLPASTNTTVLAANGSRKKAIIFCPKAAVFFKLGAGASGTSFTYKTPGADSILEVTIYTGQIDAFGPATTLNVTEMV